MPLTEATTGRTVRTQDTQGSPRVCGRWGYAVVGRGGRGGHMGGVASVPGAADARRLRGRVRGVRGRAAVRISSLGGVVSPIFGA